MNLDSITLQIKSHKLLIILSSFTLILVVSLGSYTLILNANKAKPVNTSTEKKVATSASTPKVATTTPQPAAVNPPSTPQTTQKPTSKPLVQAPPPTVTLPVLPFNYNVGDVFLLSPFTIKITRAQVNNPSQPGCSGTSTDQFFEVDFVYTQPDSTSSLSNYSQGLTLVTSSGSKLNRISLCHSFVDNVGGDINSSNLNSSYLFFLIPTSTVSATVTFNSVSGSAIVKVK